MLSGTVDQYIGRSVDMMAFDGMQATGDRQLIQTLVVPGGSGALHTGIQKLAHRFLIELITVQGSLQYLPARGTPFMTDAFRGAWRTAADVQSSFSLAKFIAKQNLQGEESPDDPDDERYADAEMLNIFIEADSVSISVRVISLAGSSIDIIFPIRVNVVR